MFDVSLLRHSCSDQRAGDFAVVATAVADHSNPIVKSLSAQAVRWLIRGLVVMIAAVALHGCRRSEPGASVPSARAATSTAVEEATTLLVSSPIGAPIEGRPWITHVCASDLDRDGRIDLLVCDAKANTITWLRQTGPGVFAESVLASDIPAPVHTEPVDMEGDGDLDLLIASMGQVFPNNDKIGAVVILENDGSQGFTRHVVVDRIARVTDVRAADFDGDGKLDLAVGQFGYDEGEVRWMRNLGDWRFESHILLSLAGTVNVCPADLTGDGKVDFVALVSQQWEEVYLFENDGRGNFSSRVIFGSTNEDFGSSGLVLCDLNRDGREDLLYTNGDGFDYAQPGSRPWHGVQWLENRGGGFFRPHRIGGFEGAYSPVGVDFDDDGDMDVVAVSGFNEWNDPKAASLMLFKNDGRMNFTRHVLARKPTHLLTCVAADFDGTGKPVFVTGGFHAYPPWDRMSRLMIWRRNPAP
jgi:hypothetical protein